MEPRLVSHDELMAEFRPLLDRPVSRITHIPADSITQWLHQTEAPGNGCKDAAQELLRATGIAISAIDINDPVDTGPDSDRDDYFTPHKDSLIGFNGHGCGSEGDHKILLNGTTNDGQDTQFVLFAPPTEGGELSNTTFYAGRHDETWVPVDGRRDTLPAPLKMAEAARLTRDVTSPESYLFYTDTDPFACVRSEFEAAGFAFQDEPMDVQQHDELERLSKAAPSWRQSAWPNYTID